MTSLGHQKKFMQKLNDLAEQGEEAGFDSHTEDSVSSVNDTNSASESSRSSTGGTGGRLKLTVELNGEKRPLVVKTKAPWGKIKHKLYQCVGDEDRVTHFYYREGMDLLRIDTATAWKSYMFNVESGRTVDIIAKLPHPNDPSEVECMMAESMVDGVVYMDTVGRILFTSGKVTAISGYSPKELVGQNVKMLMPKEIAVQHDGFLKNYLKTGVKKVIGSGRSLTLQTKDGKRVPIWLSVSEQRNSKGRHIFIGHMHVTSASDNEKDPFHVLKSIQSPVFVIDPVGKLAFANEVGAGAFGYTPEEMVGQNVKIMMPDHVAKNHDGYLKNFMRSGQAKIIGKGARSLIAKGKDGELFPVELAVSETIVQGERYFVGHMLPGKDEVDSEEEETLLEQTRSVIDTIALPGIIINHKGTVQAFNKASEKMFGYKLSQIAGRNVTKLMTGDDRKNHASYLARWLKTRQDRIVGKTRNVMGKTKSGELIPITLAISYREQGNDLLFVAILLHNTGGDGDSDSEEVVYNDHL